MRLYLLGDGKTFSRALLPHQTLPTPHRPELTAVEAEKVIAGLLTLLMGHGKEQGIGLPPGRKHQCLPPPPSFTQLRSTKYPLWAR